MKKIAVLGTTLCMGMLLASCGSSKESAYRKAYEKARAQDAAEQPVQEQVLRQEQERQPVQLQEQRQQERRRPLQQLHYKVYRLQ